MPRLHMAILGGGAVSYQRGTPVRGTSFPGYSGRNVTRSLTFGVFPGQNLFFFFITLKPRVE